MTVAQALTRATRRLSVPPVPDLVGDDPGSVSDSPSLDAEVLAALCLRTDRGALFSRPERRLTAKQHRRYTRLIARRRRGWPIPYLTGRRAFDQLSLKVTRQVLIPRPATELLVEAVAQTVADTPSTVIADIGTGSGAIALALATRLVKAKIIGTDISRGAVHVARENARRSVGYRRVTFRTGSLLTPWRRFASPTVVVANLPYLNTRQRRHQSLRYEPRLALDGGRDGLQTIRQLFAQLPDFPTVSVLALEIDPSQVRTVRRWMRQWAPVSVVTSITDGRTVRGLLAQQTPRPMPVQRGQQTGRP